MLTSTPADLNIACKNVREKKKRGKISQKDLKPNISTAATTEATAPPPSRPTSTSSSNNVLPSYNELPHGAISEPETIRPRLPPLHHNAQVGTAPIAFAAEQRNGQHENAQRIFDPLQPLSRADPVLHPDQSRLPQAPYAMPTTQSVQNSIQPRAFPPYLGSSFSITDSQHASRQNTSLDFLGDSPSGAGMHHPTNSPRFPVLPSPTSGSTMAGRDARSAVNCRYPVIKPLLPHIGSFLSQSLACTLLDHYFETAAPSNYLPSSPYIFAFVYRKTSFLHQYTYRWRSPALLASMLYVTAQTSDAPYLSSTPSRRSQICQKLFQLAVSLLKPLVHGSCPQPASSGVGPIEPGLVLGGLVATDHPGAEKSSHAALDDVATYMHLATVVSASEFKRASLRWWGGAWFLAKELQLGQEMVADPNGPELYPDVMNDGRTDIKTPDIIDEEEREERRRIWWILYLMERHLALCYNSPITLLDRECQGLLQPLDEEAWQSGAFLDPTVAGTLRRQCGPPLHFTGVSVFGCVLPLMNILGQIVQLQDMRNQPRFSNAFQALGFWEPYTTDIIGQLHVFEQSMRNFLTLIPNDARPDMDSYSAQLAQASESAILARTAVAYGAHIMHVLHILTAGRWDPIALFDDADGWISSPSFVTATSHAVEAAEALSEVLELDPDLSFMPFLYGIYLLQGSFLLLLLADKLQQNAGASVVHACETIVRAHEVCVVTLSTGYQVSRHPVSSPAKAGMTLHNAATADTGGTEEFSSRDALRAAAGPWPGDGGLWRGATAPARGAGSVPMGRRRQRTCAVRG